MWGDSALPVVDDAEKLKDKFNKKELNDYHFGGSAFLTKEKIVFALVVDNKEKSVITLIYSQNGNAKKEFKHKETAEKCYPYFFPWGDKIMMIPTACGADRN